MVYRFHRQDRRTTQDSVSFVTLGKSKDKVSISCVFSNYGGISHE